MIGQTSVKQALHVDIAISPEMASALQLWSLMYQNQAPWLNETVKSLNLPASIASEIARAVTIEMQVEFTGSVRADYLEAQFEPVLSRLREQIEKGCAKGGLMLKPYVDGGNIAVDYVQADQFYPVTFDANGHIAACIFADSRTIGDKYYTRLEYHQMTPEGCAITNAAYRSETRDMLGQAVPLTSVDAWASLEPEAVITGIDRPLFAYFRFPMANNIDPNSPLGVSCYSRAADLIQDADTQWSNLMWEFEAGKKAIYVDTLAFGKDEKGKPKLPDKRLYRSIETVGSNVGEGSHLFEEWSPEFRDASIKSGLDAILKRIEYATGLAYGTLSDPQETAKTATELTMSKQRTYATIVDTQRALQTTLEQLIWSMDIWASLSRLSPKGSYSTAFDFDDSVVVDKDLQFQQDMRLVNGGLMSKVEFRMRNMGEDEATAKAAIAAVAAEQPPDLFSGQGVQ